MFLNQLKILVFFSLIDFGCVSKIKFIFSNIILLILPSLFLAGFIKGTLMQIWKFLFMFVFI